MVASRAPVRARRLELEKDGDAVVRRTLERGNAQANRAGEETLRLMRKAMNMDYGIV